MTTEEHEYLPYGRQFLDDDDIAAVVEVLKGDWLTTGPAVHAFEKAFSGVAQSDYVVSCCNGTAALHLAYMALDIGPGDRVIVPSISFIATANGAAYCAADILFSDVDPDTGLMRAADVLRLLESLTPAELQSVKAVVPVNMAGQVAELEAIYAIAQRHGWKMIVDSCHAIGTTYQSAGGETCTAGDCRFADMEVFSFHAVKTVAMGEGGAVTTNDKDCYDKLCLLRNHGMQRDPEKWLMDWGSLIPPPWYYEMQLLGYNYRQSDIHSALGISQLKKLPAFIEQRRRLAAKYDELLSGLSPHIRPLRKVDGCDPAWHLYVILVDFKALKLGRVALVNQLAVKNIGTQVHYIPIYRQPFYEANYGKLVRPDAETYYKATLSLPLHVTMTADDVAYVVDQLATAAAES